MSRVCDSNVSTCTCALRFPGRSGGACQFDRQLGRKEKAVMGNAGLEGCRT
jgi:hypothetical protein